MENNKFMYKAFNLKIVSDFSLFGLKENKTFAEADADVRVIYGKVQEDKGNAPYDYSSNIFTFQIIDYAKGKVSNGNEIIIEPCTGATESQISLIILVTAFYILLAQRDCLVLHGSAIMVDGKGIVVIGDSGAGKTSLTIALRKRGGFFIADDIAAISFRDLNAPYILPAYPFQKIKIHTASENGIDVHNLLKADFDDDKYFLPITDRVADFCVPLSAIFFLTVKDTLYNDLKEISGIDKLDILIKNTHGLKNISIMRKKSQHFQNCSYLANRIPIFRLTRPEKGFTTDKQLELIFQRLQSYKYDLGECL